jgi:hypothetical protein
MTRVRESILAGLIIAVAAAASSCGGSTAKPRTPVASPSAKTSASPSSGLANGVPTESPPPGYKWAGSTAQGVWLAVPDSWAAINLAKVDVTQAISRLKPKGISGSFLKPAVRQLSKQHAIFAVDLASAVRSPHQFATNVNAFCGSTPLVPDMSSSPVLKAMARAQYAQAGWHVLALRDAAIDGHAGVKSTYTIPTAVGMTITDTQYMVLTKNSRLCTITLTTDNPGRFRRTFSKIGHSILVH